MKKIIFLFFFIIMTGIVYADYPSGYSMCKNITIINPTGVVQTDFIINLNVSYDADMQTDFDDLRFYTNGCGETGSLLFAELESKTDSVNAYVWVKNNLTTTNTTISMYFGNSTNTANWNNASDSYDTGYYHLTDTHDSSPYKYVGAEDGGVLASTTCAWGGCYWFDNVNDRINITNPYFYANNQNFTFSVWTRHQANASSDRIFTWFDSAGSPYGGFQMGTSGASAFNFILQANSTTTTTKTSTAKYINNSWTQSAYVVKTGNYVTNTTVDFYKNGIFVETMAFNSSFLITYAPDSTTTAYIGTRNTATWYLGFIDEIRINNVTRSSSFINLSYQYVANYNSFILTGEQQNSTSPIINQCEYLGSGDFNQTDTSCNITAYYVIESGFNWWIKNSTVWCNASIPKLSGSGQAHWVSGLLRFFKW